MIILTKLNGTKFVLNSDLIETIKETPDTTIRLMNKNLYIVQEPIQEIIRLVVEFRRQAGDVLSRIPMESQREADTEQ